MTTSVGNNSENYLEHPILAAPVALPGHQVPSEALVAHAAWVKGQKEVAVLMLLTMDLDIQRNLSHLGDYDMLQELKALYSKQAEQELLQTMREFHTCKQEEVSLILVSLNRDFDSFVHNYNMHDMGKTVNELHAMLKLHEETLPKKDANSGKGKMGYAFNNAPFAPKPKTPLPPKKDNPAKDSICHQCGEVGHWRRNRPVYLAELMKKKKLSQGASTSGSTGNKKRIEKLQHDGLLNSIDIESLGKCVSCMSEKMSRKPHSHQVKRAKDLLGLIHTDVCGPFKIMSRQGASYFITFTDDFSHYGYVYLLKHKHEVFETFKVFQKEVENQLGKTIKSLRSDRGGYPKETMGSSFYSPSENKLFVARNAEFFESKLLDLKASGSVKDLKLIQEEDTNPSVDTSLNHKEDDQEINEPQSDINPIRKSSRTRRTPDHMCLYIDAEVHELGDLDEPANYKAALLDPESKKWLDAMNVEMQSMKDNDVWVLVELPPNARTVGSKWLFKKKIDMDVALYIFKARLIANGFTQTYGVDYEETFSLVADIRAIRILIAIAAYYNYDIWQMDVKTAFLNGHLFEEVYMEQPEGFVNPKYPNHVCKLIRSIYGLKQASRQWNKRFDDEIKKFGFTQNPDEPCVYLKASRSYIAILILYVDDILLMGNNIPMLQDVKSYLGRNFAMKDLGDAAYIFGINIYRDRAQSMYCDNTGAIAIAKDDGVTKGARYFCAKVHYLRETIKLGDVKIENIDTDDNLADPFIKALAFPKHSELTRNIGLLPASSFM
uniref:Retrotransposon protein, putative, Ty1-copia subclass n=1 Tax=Tanacetum cinerariifolium TaxID=118510 RepID=A0A6L2KV73_TANCI|nr:retrotransposon protein, putative, Ty1-copia subclass [Tanacetum cinerariifolium]